MAICNHFLSNTCIFILYNIRFTEVIYTIIFIDVQNNAKNTFEKNLKKYLFTYFLLLIKKKRIKHLFCRIIIIIIILLLNKFYIVFEKLRL